MSIVEGVEGYFNRTLLRLMRGFRGPLYLQRLLVMANLIQKMKDREMLVLMLPLVFEDKLHGACLYHSLKCRK